MARRAVDDYVKLSSKYDSLKENEEFKSSGVDYDKLMVSDKVPKLQLKQSTVTVELTVIDSIINAYNRIDIEDDACFLEVPGGRVPVSKNRLRFMKALLCSVKSPSKDFTTCVVAFTQHVFGECMRRTGPSAIISNSSNKVQDLIYRELSDFYINCCG